MPPDRTPAADLAAQRVEAVRDDPAARYALLRSSYAPLVGRPPRHRAYQRAALAFMGWQLQRGVLEPPHADRPGSPWWRAVNERLLRDTCEARLRLLGHPGPSSSGSVEASVAFASAPSPRSWYLAHNVTIVSALLEHDELAARENRVERFFINLVLVRVLFAHALVAAPGMALGWLGPIAGRLGDPRRDATGRFLAVARVLPDVYPLRGQLDAYIADEHALGRLLDVGVIVPRLAELYRWSAGQLGIPGLAGLVRGDIPAYAWDPADHAPWTPPATGLVRLTRTLLPPRPSSG